MARDLPISARLQAVEHALAVMWAGLVANRAAAVGRPNTELSLVAEEALFGALSPGASADTRRALAALALRIADLAEDIDPEPGPRPV